MHFLLKTKDFEHGTKKIGILCRLMNAIETSMKLLETNEEPTRMRESVKV